jgi:hypothetical protein
MIRIDGSMESLVIVLTGADVCCRSCVFDLFSLHNIYQVRINEDQLHYLDAKQRHVIQEMCQVHKLCSKVITNMSFMHAVGD